MTETVRIVIPSHKRADRVTTLQRCLPPDKVTLCVAKAQEAEYREHNPLTEIVAHPDDVVGLPRKREWIGEHFGSNFQCDDDQKYFVHMEHVVGEPECKLDPEDAYALIQNTAAMADDLGVYLFSFSPYPDILVFNPMDPIKLTGWVIGGKLGWLHPKKSGLWFNDSIVGKTDFWISALNAHVNRMALIDLRYATKSMPDFVTSGGTASTRTQESERRDTEILVKHFGSDVIRVKTRTPRSKGGSGHADQCTLSIPF